MINLSWWITIPSCWECVVCGVLGVEENEPEAAFVLLDSSQSEGVQPLGKWVQFSVLWFSRPKHVGHVQTNIFGLVHATASDHPYQFLHNEFTCTSWICSVLKCRTARLSYVKPCLAMCQVDNHLSIRSVCWLPTTEYFIAIWASLTPRKHKHCFPLKHLLFPQCRQSESLSIHQPWTRM